MRSIKAAVIFIVCLVLTIFMLFKTMNAMQTTSNATLVLSKEVCPASAEINNGSCVIRGNLSHHFVTGEAEVTLQDGTTMMFDRKYLYGYSRDEDAVSYEPLGKWFAFLVGIGIIGFGFWCALGAPGAKQASKKR